MSWTFQQRGGSSWYEFSEWCGAEISHGFLLGTHDFRQPEKAWRDFQHDTCSLHTEARNPLLLLRQTHGVQVVPYSGECGGRLEGDAWCDTLTWAVPANLGILTADCLPVLVRCKASGAVGAAHCGWRSAVGGILPGLLKQLTAETNSTRHLEILIGPGIGPCCFEVGPEVVAQLEQSRELFAPDVTPKDAWIRSHGSSYFADLAELLVAQALSTGVQAGHIHCLGICTFCDPRFFSYRRQKDLSGRQLSFIERPRSPKKA